MQKVLELSRGLKEAGKLDQAIEQQAERIARALKLECDMGGLMMPSLWREYETLMKLCQALQTMKSDLGFPGYQRVPRVLDMRFMPPPEAGQSWQQLTEGERDKLLEFAQEMDRVFDVTAEAVKDAS